MKKEYTISVFSEHKVGLLHRITVIFSRRKINIESLNTSESEVRGIYRFTIVINATEDMAKTVTKQIEKQIRKIAALTVLEAMTPKVVSVHPDTEIETVAALMVDSNFHTLPVVEGSRLVGVIGKEDVLRTLLSTYESH